WVVDLGAGAATVGAGLREPERALAALGDPVAVAGAAHLGAGPGPGAATVAGQTRGGGRELELDRLAECGLGVTERERGLGGLAAARALRPTTSGSAAAGLVEQPSEQVREPSGAAARGSAAEQVAQVEVAGGGVGATRRAEPAEASRGDLLPELVVLLTFGGV